MQESAGTLTAAIVAVCSTLIAIFARPATAATPLAVEDVLQAPALAAYSPSSFSPDNRLLAYVVTDNSRRHVAVDDDELLRTEVAWYGVAADIWITDLEAGTHRNVTGARGHNWTPSWSPDGERLAFLADRDGGPQPGPARLWAWERSSEQLRVASDADVREGFAQLQWAGDAHSVLVSLFPAALGRDGYAALIKGRAPGAAAAAGAPGKSTPEIFEFDPALPNSVPSADQVNLDTWLRDLALIDIRTGKVRRLTRDARIGHYLVSPDRRQLAYSVLTGAERPGAGQYLYDVVVQDVGGYAHLAPDGTNYGLAWAESGQGRMGGNPWEFRERYLENSPIFCLDRVETPLLIIHGDKDDTVPVFLADEVFTGLRRLRKAVTYVRYPGEGPWKGTWSHADQIDALNQQIAWFDRYLKGAAPPASDQNAGAKRP